MKRWLNLFILSFGFICCSVLINNQAIASTASFEVGSTSYNINGYTQTMEVAPYVSNGRTYMPILYVANALSIQENDIKWDPHIQSITLMKGDKVVQLKIGSTTLLVNGAAIRMDVAPEINNGRTCLPISLIAQAFGAYASWDFETQTVRLSSDSVSNNTNNAKLAFTKDIFQWNGVHFGMTQDEVKSLLGDPDGQAKSQVWIWRYGDIFVEFGHNSALVVGMWNLLTVDNKIYVSDDYSKLTDLYGEPTGESGICNWAYGTAMEYRTPYGVVIFDIYNGKINQIMLSNYDYF